MSSNAQDFAQALVQAMASRSLTADYIPFLVKLEVEAGRAGGKLAPLASRIYAAVGAGRDGRYRQDGR